MHKLIILIPGSDGLPENWHIFLRQAELLPGLRRESTSHILHQLYGDADHGIIHELFFDDLPALEKALGSEVGNRAAKTLHTITGGRVSLLVADHKEDDLENIRKFTSPGGESPDV